MRIFLECPHVQLFAARVSHIGSTDQRLFASPASPAYTALRGTQGQALWRLRGDVNVADVVVRGRFMANNVGLMCVLAERGVGMGVLDPSLVRNALGSGSLLPVLSEWAAPRRTVHAVMSWCVQPASVRALLSFLVVRLARLVLLVR
jgi:DNA-binding transcriptional LysR family regulator